MRLPALLPLSCALLLSLPAAPRHATLLREAAAAARAGDNATALDRMEAAAKLRPDYPRVQFNLARLYAAAGRPDDARAALQRLADMKLQMDLSRDPGLAGLAEETRFRDVFAALARGPEPAGAEGEAAFALTDVTGIIESCLVDPGTLEWYFGDVRNRCVWRRATHGAAAALARFTHPDDALDGVFKIALSADRQVLWAATATVGAMIGPDAEDGRRSAIVAIDFATGRVRARHAVPADARKHLLGDFVLARDGSILATDSLSPVIWRLPPGGNELEVWLESDDFLSLQGIAWGPEERSLVVADYANGLWAIDVASRQPTLLRPPSQATFFGIDGLYAVPGGVLAVQNGVKPERVLRIEPSPAPEGECAVRVVKMGHPEMTDLALGHVFNGRFHFIGSSGWSLFDPPPSAPPASRSVPVLSLPIDGFSR